MKYWKRSASLPVRLQVCEKDVAPAFRRNNKAGTRRGSERAWNGFLSSDEILEDVKKAADTAQGLGKTGIPI